MCRARNSNLWGTITLFVVICCCLPAQGKYGNGTGEPNDPFLIYDANQMNAIGADANDWDKHFKMMADIDLSGYTGTAFNIIGYFTGVFDGNNHTISNLTTRLFSVVAGGEVRNLGLIDPNIVEDSSLALYLNEGTIDNCYVEGGSMELDNNGGLVTENNGIIIDCHSRINVSGSQGVAGLVQANHGTITNCYSSDSVSGLQGVAGLVLFNYGTINNCYFSGTVSGLIGVCGLVSSNYGTITACYSNGTVSGRHGVGGLVVYNYGDNAAISNSYSLGSVSGEYNVGGLVGSNCFQGVSGTITNCYSAAAVTGITNVGGLVGFNENGIVTDSLWDVNTSGLDYSDGGVGKTTAEMQMKATFTSAGWDFVDVWGICEGQDYPRLSWEEYGGGNGTADNPYLIYTSCHMNAIGADSNDWDKHFKLMADVDLSDYTGTSFNIIGCGVSWFSPDNIPFTGVFDGNGHTISNFTYTSTDVNFIGLFGYVDDPNAEIKDLGLIAPNVDAEGGEYVGSLVGWFFEGNITNCYVEGGSVSGQICVSGLVGINGIFYAQGKITNCYATTSVFGNSLVGGLVGLKHTCTVSGCYAGGTVSGITIVGGLVGHNYLGTISDCYAKSSVRGDDFIGGLVGINSSAVGIGTLNNCYSTGSVLGDANVGGLVGYHWSGGGIVNCFWDTEASGINQMCGRQGPGGSGCNDDNGKITSEMQTQSTFTGAGWDFVNIWDICDGTNYPKLSWQIPPVGDFLCPDGVNFVDYSFFAGHWAKDNCGASSNCDGTDLDLLGTVDINDLGIFVDNWLRGF